MSIVEERKAARMKALRAKPSTAAGDAGSNVIVGTFTAKPTTPPSAPPTDKAGGQQQVDDVINRHKPPEQTDKQQAAEADRQFAQDFAAKFTPFRDDEDAFHILHEGEAVSLTSTHAVDIFRSTAMGELRRLPKDNLERLQSMLRETARAEPHRTVYRRIGKDDDSYLVDLGDQGRHCARVDKHGVTVVPCGDAVFSRGKGYGELPMPVITTDAAEAWDFVQPLFLGVPERDHLPLLALMVEGLRSDTPHTILILIGQEGSGKSTVAEHCVMAIDPFIGKLPSVAHTERGFYSAAQTRHTLAMDNLSTPLPGTLEDALCRSSCGAAIMVPELYQTAESRTLRLFVKWVITGISNQISQADTLDRAWVIRVERPKHYRSPETLRAEFQSAHGQVIGALLFFLAERMRRAAGIEDTQNIQHRMYDFLVTGEAVAQALGHAAGSFIATVDFKQSTSAQDWIKYDPFAAALVTCLTDLIRMTPVPATNWGNWRKWSKQGHWVTQISGRRYVATTAETIHRMVANGTPAHMLGKVPAWIPTSAPAAADALDRIQNQMQRAGWHVMRKQVNATPGGNGKRRGNTVWVFGVPP